MVSLSHNGTKGNSLPVNKNSPQTQRNPLKKSNAATRTMGRLDALLLWDAVDPTTSDDDESVCSSDSESHEERDRVFFSLEATFLQEKTAKNQKLAIFVTK